MGSQACPFPELSDPGVGTVPKSGQSDPCSSGRSGWSRGSTRVSQAHENPSPDFVDLQCKEGVSSADWELEAPELTE